MPKAWQILIYNLGDLEVFLYYFVPSYKYGDASKYRDGDTRWKSRNEKHACCIKKNSWKTSQDVFTPVTIVT